MHRGMAMEEYSYRFALFELKYSITYRNNSEYMACLPNNFPKYPATYEIRSCHTFPSIHGECVFKLIRTGCSNNSVLIDISLGTKRNRNQTERREMSTVSIVLSWVFATYNNPKFERTAEHDREKLPKIRLRRPER